jgi:hypothetical protein
MDGEVDYEPFLKALSGADPIQSRRFAAAKALEIGWGGVSEVSAITGFSRNTINKGIQVVKNYTVGIKYVSFICYPTRDSNGEKRAKAQVQ